MKHRIFLTALSLLTLAALIVPVAARQGSGPARKHLNTADIRALEASGHLVAIGTDAWRTRGGVVLRGRDPQKRTRLEHIMRHSVDMPARPKHGVFTGNAAAVIELMDEAWKRVQSGSIRGAERAGKTAYTVDMKRDVGYMGGRDGAARGKPRLHRVRLVVRTGTAEVITFFPQ